MAMTITPHDETEFETAGRRRKITKFALAGVAVVGVGAALTSAAWSDNVFFGGTAASAEFELQGYDPISGVWVDADSAGARIVLPADELDAVGPGIGDSYTVLVQNSGDLPIYLLPPTVASTGGALFNGLEPATISFGSYSDPVLGLGESASVEVTVTGSPLWTGTEYQNLSGTLTVQIQGSSSAP